MVLWWIDARTFDESRAERTHAMREQFARDRARVAEDAKDLVFIATERLTFELSGRRRRDALGPE